MCKEQPAIQSITLYTWNTPNGRKASIALEELGLPYAVVPVDIGKDEQFDPEFLKISPNNKIPAIVDGDFTLFESGAILMYLAEKAGKLLPRHGTPEYWRVVEWLMWQVGNFGPMLGQAHHFLAYHRGTSAYAEKRYHGEALRLYRVLDERLAGREFIADQFSVADIATWCWASRFDYQQVDIADFPNVCRWYVELAGRSAFQRGYSVPVAEEIPLP
jgi:GST-like protein